MRREKEVRRERKRERGKEGEVLQVINKMSVSLNTLSQKQTFPKYLHTKQTNKFVILLTSLQELDL